jgi:hypothetical protein
MVYQFKIQIKEITNPPVWRRILIPAKYSFADFHIAIQVAFGWENAHLYQFSQKGYSSNLIIREPYEDDVFYTSADIYDSEKTKLSDIFHSEKQKFTYIYDFGDNWHHNITLEKITDEKLLFPRILAGKGACPPEDCGGTWSYMNLKEILNDPKNPEYEEYSEWLGLSKGEKWDAQIFVVDIHNKILTNVFSK